MLASVLVVIQSGTVQCAASFSTSPSSLLAATLSAFGVRTGKLTQVILPRFWLSEKSGREKERESESEERSMHEQGVFFLLFLVHTLESQSAFLPFELAFVLNLF